MTKIMIILGAIGMSILILFAQPWQRDLDCNPEELSRVQALEFAKVYLVEEGTRQFQRKYSKSDIESLELIYLHRISEESYPSFQFEFRGVINGNHTRFVGGGNGCGIDQIFDYGLPIN